MEEIIKLLNNQSSELDIYDKQLMRRLVDKIIIQTEKMGIDFKSGISVKVKKLKACLIS